MSLKTYDDIAERYYQAMLDLQQYCEDRGINFRIALTEMIVDHMAECRARERGKESES